MTREGYLVMLAQHLRYCNACHDAANFNGPMCANGARLWSAAEVREPPNPMPAEWGPCAQAGETIEHRPGPLVPIELQN